MSKRIDRHNEFDNNGFGFNLCEDHHAGFIVTVHEPDYRCKLWSDGLYITLKETGESIKVLSSHSGGWKLYGWIMWGNINLYWDLLELTNVFRMIGVPYGLQMRATLSSGEILSVHRNTVYVGTIPLATMTVNLDALSGSGKSLFSFTRTSFSEDLYKSSMYNPFLDGKHEFEELTSDKVYKEAVEIVKDTLRSSVSIDEDNGLYVICGCMSKDVFCPYPDGGKRLSENNWVAGKPIVYT